MELIFKGKALTIAPLPPSLLFKHVDALRDAVMIEAKRQMIGLPLEVCKHVWDNARADARRIELGSTRYNDEASKLPGMTHALWMAMQAAKVECGFDEVADLFAEPEKAAAAAMFALGLTPPAQKDAGRSDEPKPPGGAVGQEAEAQAA